MRQRREADGVRAAAREAEIQARLARGLAGSVGPGEPRIARDFGGVRRAFPAAVAHCRDEEDVAHCFRVAAEFGVPVGFRGAGHSCGGQSLCEGGILVENFRDEGSEPLNESHGRGASRLRRGAPSAGGLGGRPEPPMYAVESLADGGFAADAGSSWKSVEAALNAAGRAVPVLTDYQSLSVGGTLSVGGKGFHSIARGLQVDHVRRARLVLPDGRRLWCSRDEEPELFRFALGGLGQLGYLARVEMASVPWRWFTTLYVTEHGDLAGLVRALGWMATWAGPWPTQFNAVLYQGMAMAFWGLEHADAEEAGAQDRPAFLDALPAATEFQHRNYRAMTHGQTVEWLSAFSEHWKVWADYVLDYAGLGAFVEFLEGLRGAGAFGDCLEVVHLLAVRRPENAVRFALGAAQAAGAGPHFSVGLYAMVPAGDDAALGHVRDAYARCLDRCVALGGRPYLYGWAEMDEALCQRLYGADWVRLAELRREVDPAGILRDGVVSA